MDLLQSLQALADRQDRTSPSWIKLTPKDKID